MEELTNTIPDENANCRLRNGLNELCLVKIFEYLGPFDLAQLCLMDDFYQDIITNRTLKEKKLNLGEFVDTTTVKHRNNWRLFETFRIIGKSMRKIEIKTFNFVNVFQLIAKYCAPATLTELKISVQISTKAALTIP